MKERNVTILFLTVATLLYVGLFIYFNNFQPTEERKALDECIEEVTGNCKGLFNYASILEDENSRLNLLFKECRESK